VGISFNFGTKIEEFTEPKTARLPSSTGCTEKAPSIYFEK
jgi:tetrahydromethanopterin S-methyltransferase subunit D